MKSIPNILSVFRICLVPVFVIAYFLDSGEVKMYAAIVYLVASATDFLDGFIARRYNLISNLGRILDPVGDKLLLLATLTCITIDDVIPVWAIIIVVVKEVLMLAGGAVIHKKLRESMPQSNYFGKTATVVFAVVCVALLLFKGIPPYTATIMVSVAIAITLAALCSYVMTFIKVVKNAAAEK